LHDAHLVALGAGEGAALVAEELALEQRMAAQFTAWKDPLRPLAA
jgi:hypothetical protein